MVIGSCKTELVSLSDQKAHSRKGKNDANLPEQTPVPIQSFTNQPYGIGDWGLWQTFPLNVEISSPARSLRSIGGWFALGPEAFGRQVPNHP